MNSLTAYNSDSSSDDSSGDEDDVKKSVQIDETNLHLKKPVASTSTFSTSTVSFCLSIRKKIQIHMYILCVFEKCRPSVREGDTGEIHP